MWLADAKMWIVKAPGGVVAHSHRDVVAQVDVVAQGDVVAKEILRFLICLALFGIKVMCEAYLKHTWLQLQHLGSNTGILPNSVYKVKI